MKKTFIKYIEQHVDFIDVLHTTDGTYFLSVCGYDGGDLMADHVEDGPKYSNEEEVDSWIAEIASEFGVDMPQVSYAEFCNTK